MKSFESAPLPEQSERREWDMEQAIVKESSVLEKFRGKAKDIARVMLFVSALSAGAVGAKEAYAGEMKEAVTNEQAQKSLPQSKKEIIQFVHPNNETSELYVAIHGFMGHALRAAENAKNVSDAVLVFAYFDEILSFYPSERLDTKEGAGEIRRQLGDVVEMKFLLETAKKMKINTLDMLRKFPEFSQYKTSLMSPDKRLAAIDRMINELQWIEEMSE